jgi:hypothetical protein
MYENAAVYQEGRFVKLFSALEVVPQHFHIINDRKTDGGNDSCLSPNCFGFEI